MLLVSMVHGAIHSAAVWTAIVAGASLIYFFLWKQKRSKFVNAIDKLPGPSYNSILGHALLFNVSREEKYTTMLSLFSKFIGQPLVRIWIGPAVKLFLMNAEAAEAVLGHPKEIDKGEQYRFIVPWLGVGLVIGSGQKWHTRRRLVTPTFHFRILEDFVHVYNAKSVLFLDVIKDSIGKTTNYYPYLKSLALDIICETAMGTSIDAQKEINSEYARAVAVMSEVFHMRSFTPWLRNDFIFYFTKYGKQQRWACNVLHGFSNKVISERRAEHQQNKLNSKPVTKSDADQEIEGKKKRVAFLDMLLEASDNGYNLSQEDIREEVDTFMFEGHDSTSTAMLWLLFALAKHPEVQEKVHQEMDSVFGGYENMVTGEDIKQLKYLECVIKETMRLYPPVPFYGRQLQNEMNIAGHSIPADTTVIVNTYFVHRDPKQFPDPERYDPDRFLPENSAGRNPYAFVPFSAGPRNCIGQKFAIMEEKVVLSHILRRYKVSCTQNFEDLKVISEIVLQPAPSVGIQLKLELRK